MSAREEFYYRKLLKWANGDDVSLSADLPWTSIPKIVPETASRDAWHRKVIIDYLNGLASGNEEAIPQTIAAINCAELKWGIVEGINGCAEPKIFVNHWIDICWTLMYVGLSAPYKVKDGLPIAAFTRKCEHCKKFFLSKTRKWSCYCSRQCRDAEKYKRNRTSRHSKEESASSA